MAFAVVLGTLAVPTVAPFGNQLTAFGDEGLVVASQRHQRVLLDQLLQFVCPDETEVVVLTVNAVAMTSTSGSVAQTLAVQLEALGVLAVAPDLVVAVHLLLPPVPLLCMDPL